MTFWMGSSRYIRLQYDDFLISIPLDRPDGTGAIHYERKSPARVRDKQTCQVHYYIIYQQLFSHVPSLAHLLFYLFY